MVINIKTIELLWRRGVMNIIYFRICIIGTDFISPSDEDDDLSVA